MGFILSVTEIAIRRALKGAGIAGVARIREPLLSAQETFHQHGQF